jgi:hypothetical protein
MTHNCRLSYCETPHNELDGHANECGCDRCHEFHDWREWTVYPECDGCLLDLSLWLVENTDYFELQRLHRKTIAKGEAA